MNPAYRYVMLLTSLPRHPASLFAAERLPISRIQLDKRLAQLCAEHRHQLQVIEQLLHWRLIETLDDDRLLAQEAALTAELDDPNVRDMVHWRLELRALIAALRLKKQGQPLTAQQAKLLGKDAWLIQRHWQQADLGLGHRHAWLSEAWQYLDTRQSLALERLLLSLVWDYYTRLGERQRFGFPAVVIYVLKWDVLHRYSQHHAAAAWDTFQRQVEHVIHTNPHVNASLA
ncbi:MAG: DUF2764 domain-containing protein [Methylococcales bacterium]|nr:DUF2764 domain-containing protein [Methylococcales bacterium]